MPKAFYHFQLTTRKPQGILGRERTFQSGRAILSSGIAPSASRDPSDDEPPAGPVCRSQSKCLCAPDAKSA